MYDDETPTANSAQEWLNFLSFWHEKSLQMTDRFLRDFSAKVSAAGVQMTLDQNGALTIIQSGSHYFVIGSHLVREFMTALNSLTNAIEPLIEDDASTYGLRNAPPTNAQMSMRQNELTLKYLKQRR